MLESMRLSELQLPLSGRLVGASASFTAVSTDSRAIEPGQLFIALTGPRFDGHAYLADVAAKGAVAALVEREVADAGLPQLVVADTRLAL
ncbi:MAG TPA: UDP-N-acetylmuramoyl-tripeptide--D-alanyl-D-alanine ligase, partial [Pseudomonas sp.]|nr:UDP-N-acetylmuramoyl-tripeptide--D-alanyl-D-alanine ligase [Pseudomonas sp.]